MSDFDDPGVRIQTSAERETLILNAVEQRRILGMSELQAITGASLPTLRRDLARLAKEGSLERTRGGARAKGSPSTLDEMFESRRLRNAREKTLIGKCAADLVTDGSLIFTNDGSTILSFAMEVVNNGTDITVATSALNIAEFFASSPHVEVLSLGGYLRESSFGVVGPLTIRSLEALHATVAFLGCSGLDSTWGVMWNAVDDAHVAQVMAERSQLVIVLADSSKIGREARACGLAWKDVDIVVTDSAPVEFQEHLATHNVRLICPQ